MKWFKDLFWIEDVTEPAVKKSTLTELMHHLQKEFNDNPEYIGVLDVTYNSPHGNLKYNDTFWLIPDTSGILAVAANKNMLSYEPGQYINDGNILKVLLSDRYELETTMYDTMAKIALNWSLSWVSKEDVRPITESFVTNALASAIPHTARIMFDNLYVMENFPSDKCVRLTLSANYQNVVIPYWYVDLAINQYDLTLAEDLNTYTILDELKVERHILPATHWRRWMVVTPAEDNAKAAVKYVPRGTGQGRVQYFDVVFDFDDTTLGGLAFNTGELLKGAIGHLKNTLDKSIPDGESIWVGPYNLGQHPKSDVYINTDWIMVRWLERYYSLENYLELERNSTTNLERPYLAPNQEEVSIVGNKFSISSDYYINFTPWTPNK